MLKRCFYCSSKHVLPNALSHAPMCFCQGHFNIWICPWGRRQRKCPNKWKLVSHGMDTSDVLLNTSLPSKGSQHRKYTERTYSCLPFLRGTICTQASCFLKDDLGMYGQGQTNHVVYQQLDESLPRESKYSWCTLAQRCHLGRDMTYWIWEYPAARVGAGGATA